MPRSQQKDATDTAQERVSKRKIFNLFSKTNQNTEIQHYCFCAYPIPLPYFLLSTPYNDRYAAIQTQYQKMWILSNRFFFYFLFDWQDCAKHRWSKIRSDTIHTWSNITRSLFCVLKIFGNEETKNQTTTKVPRNQYQIRYFLFFVASWSNEIRRCCWVEIEDRRARRSTQTVAWSRSTSQLQA